MTYILSVLPNFQIIWNFGIFDNISACQLTIIFGGFPRVCAGFIQKFWLLCGFLSIPSPYSFHSPTPCLSVCMSVDIGVGRACFWMMRESVGVWFESIAGVFVCLFGWVIIGLRVCLSLFLALLYIYNITCKRGLLCVYNLGRQPFTPARVLIICKKIFFWHRGGVGRKVVGGNRCTAPSPTDSWALHILFR